MKKIAVFGKPGSGKSSLSKQLALIKHLPLHQLDSIAFRKDGAAEIREVFDKKHRDILSEDNWIIDGLGPLDSFSQRLESADTLIYIDLPYYVSYWLVTKRMLKGLAVKPEGWPEGSSIVKGTINSYKFLRLSPKFWNADFEQRLKSFDENKSVHIIRSLSELNAFISQLKSQPIEAS
ncbi:adenylate kinase [Vibrio europaeus]|uniref:Adenylate kinase n=1 Tax=Vibrio europaeus TaxID=300876 RepID=A0A178JFI3_9VIBR|nr:adenylate kinase [Vibrio europaeus]MDC5707639.1 adenylate kinase [Vibrio europaeus]MDC5709885.1 adenylate kinase [Vibrio europaeus]MDC5716638.1 adenylate kinase [Vibrio europaeus]MDC5726958.1 adenylate kinase [Vibrio europaeus]MDC5732407.1 adenylate kinase [Vibrio europaeus]